MSEEETLRDGRLSFNYIPSGKQLPRTPPLTSVKKQLDFCNEDSNEGLQQSAEAGGRGQDDDNQNTTFDFNAFGTKPEAEEPNSMLTGMKGYQLTQTDLEFMEKIRAEKLLKKLQGDLEEVQRSLKKEMMPLELASASKKKAEAELQKFPSCEELTEWVKLVLKMTSPSAETTDLDAKSLLAMVTVNNIHRAQEEKRRELTRMEKMVANKRKKEAQAKGQLEKLVACEQLKIQGFMSLLSDLKSELAQQEEVYRALEIQVSAQEAAEVKAEDASEELQAAKRPVRGRGKGGTKAPKSIEHLKDTTNQSKSTRRKLGDSRTSGKDDQGGDDASRSVKTKEKRARGPAQKVQEQESSSREAARGSRKAAGAAAPRRDHPSRAECGEAAAEETQPPALRRSKRIASRT
uniref:Uncharacterized protein n=1 Tax=Gasterosteus aculeatus aculeatus TaxID=481459 RepID=A0AAQ4NWX9_GASAC|nr:uncharacterized protein si:dkeyp-34c12.1 [Gasterosteus aculeatus aculeatus]